MKLRDHLHNNSTLTIEIDGLDKDDKENEIITMDTRFDYTLKFLFEDGPTYTGKGDWLCDMSIEYDGQCYEAVKTELLADLKTVLINHILDLEG